METLLCESKVINKNPKYRIIKYDSEYLMIDLASNWIVFFFPFINWLIPKTYVKITKNDYEKLNIVKPVKNKSIGWTIFAGIVLLGGTVRRNTYPHIPLRFSLSFILLFNFITCKSVSLVLYLCHITILLFQYRYHVHLILVRRSFVLNLSYYYHEINVKDRYVSYYL